MYDEVVNFTYLYLIPNAVSLSSSSNCIYKCTSFWYWFYSRSWCPYFANGPTRANTSSKSSLISTQRKFRVMGFITSSSNRKYQWACYANVLARILWGSWVPSTTAIFASTPTWLVNATFHAADSAISCYKCIFTFWIF